MVDDDSPQEEQEPTQAMADVVEEEPTTTAIPTQAAPQAEGPSAEQTVTAPYAVEAEQTTQVVPPQPSPSSPQQPVQPAQPGYQQQPQQPPNFMPPGGLPAGGLPPQPGAYPQGPYSGVYAGVPVGAPTVGPTRGPAILSVADLLPALRDGVIALAAALVTALIAIVLVVLVGLSNTSVHVGFGDYFRTAVWVTASSLGAPLIGSISESVNLGSDTSGLASGDLSSAATASLRLTVWLLTIIVLLLTYRFARQRERAAPSHSLGQLAARAALPAVVVSIALLILALVTRTSNPFGLMGYLNGSALADDSVGVQGVSGSFGIDTPLVLVGPLLLVFAFALLARLGVWIHAMPADPRAMRMRTQLARWTPSFRVVWLQTRVIGALVAGGLWVFVAYEVITEHTLSHGGIVVLLDGLFLLPNYAIYGTFAGFGVTLFASVSGLGAVLSSIASSGASGTDGSSAGSPADSGYGIGLFAGERPWGLWLLLLAVLIGTLAPAILARRGGRFAVNRDDYPANDVWRSALLGVVTALAVTLLGALSVTLGVGLGDAGASADSLSVSESFGPSLLAAVGLTALWFLLSYLALSFSLGHRFQAVRATSPGVAYPAAAPYQQPYGAEYAAQNGDPTIPYAQPSSTAPFESNPYESAQQPYPQPYPQQYQQSYEQQYQQPYQQTQPQPQTPPRRGYRPKLVIPIVIVLILAIGGLLGYHFLVSDKSLPGAEAAVSTYFQDLEAGNATGAAALATGPYQDTPIVSAATLADATDRPSDLTIVSSSAATAAAAKTFASEGVTGTNLTYVVVKYKVHGATLTDTYVAEQDSKTSKWLLFDPYQELSVSGGWSSTVTVDGVSFDESSSVNVFPGAHVVADPSSADFAADSVTVYPVDQQVGGTDGIPNVTAAGFAQASLPDPTLSAAGQSAAQTAYSAALNQCANDAETGYGECGLDDTYQYYTCNSVTWTITTVGTVQVDLSSQDSDGSFEMSATGSAASESGDYTDFEGDDQTFSDQSQDVEDNDGTIVFNDDGTATVTLTN